MENSDYSTDLLDSNNSDSIVVISEHDLKESFTLESYDSIDSDNSDREDYLFKPGDSHLEPEESLTTDSFEKLAKHIEPEPRVETQATHKPTEPLIEREESPKSSKPFVERKEPPKATQPIAEKKQSPVATESLMNKKELPKKTETTEQIKTEIKVPKTRQKKEPLEFKLDSPEPKKAPRKARKDPYTHCKEEIPRLEEKMSKLDLDGLHETPWRKTVNWDNQFEVLAELKDEVENYEPLGELQTGDFSFPHVNVLLYGGVGAGKSSVFNTFNSVFRGRIFNVARSGCSEHSLTTKFSKYKVMSGSSTHPQPLKFKICDLRGLEPDHLMTKENLRYILEGHIADKFPFDPSGTVSQDMPGFNKYPKLEDRMQCVCLVQDASVVDAMQDLNPDITKNIKDMQTVMNSLDIPQVVILTKIDVLCPETKRDVANAFKSPKVEKCVSKVSEILGLPRNAIYPMKNYEMEYQLDPAVDILALLTLKGILTNCDAHLFNYHEEIKKSYPSQERH